VLAMYRLRRYRSERTATELAALAGLVLILLGAFPALANLPAELFALRDHPRGRLLTLLILAVAVLWFMLLWNRAKIARLSALQDRLFARLAHERMTWPDGVGGHPPPGAVWVIIPALDEADNLPSLLPNLPASLGGHPVVTLVVDDGSHDDTGAVAARHGAAVARLPVNAGGGTGLRTGFDIALAYGAQYVVTMDADGQHDPAYLEALLEPLRRGEAEVVIGSRTLGAEAPASAARALGVRLFNQLISWLLGIRITDCASGYRAMTAQALRQLHLAQPQYHTAELIIEAAKRGFRIVDVGVAIGPRWSGESKKGRDWSYGLMFLRTVIKTWLR